MNSSSWRNHYEQNRLNRSEPDWDAPCEVPDDLRDKLAVSLSHFQLGETGGGSFLLREAAKESDADDLAALRLFIDEEKEHARLLARMVRRLGGDLIARHWTYRLFKGARRAGGFRFAVQMLLTGEIVGTAYYEMVKSAMRDPALDAAIGLMLRDEASHIAFHRDRQALRWRDYFPIERAIWALQFQVLVLAAVRAAWLDHGPCLRALGFTRDDFSRRTRQISVQFLAGLEHPSAACTTCPVGKAKAKAVTG
jgi:hypothetical protein